jgi:hypothetical protein
VTRRRDGVDRVFVGRGLVVVGIVGVVAALVATVVGVRLLGQLDRALTDSVAVASDAIDALGATVEIAGDTTRQLTVTLERTATTTRDLSGAIGDAEVVLRATAEVSEDQIAGSVAGVEDALPALVQVAAVVDRTLSALTLVPFGPDYDPEEPLDDSLRTVQAELDGLPEALREQADLVRDASRDLRTVRVGTGAIADDLDGLVATLEGTIELLERYEATAGDARDLVAGQELTGQLTAARVLVLILGMAVALGQLVPVGAGWLLLHPDVARRLLAEEPARG